PCVWRTQAAPLPLSSKAVLRAPASPEANSREELRSRPVSTHFCRFLLASCRLTSLWRTNRFVSKAASARCANCRNYSIWRPRAAKRADRQLLQAKSGGLQRAVGCAGLPSSDGRATVSVDRRSAGLKAGAARATACGG